MSQVRMNLTCLRRWHAAITLPTLGHTMAAWLDGSLPSRPGRPPGKGPHADPACPEAIPALQAVNKAGFVTIDFQTGSAFTSDRGVRWHYYPAVQGFINYPMLHSLLPVLDQAQMKYKICHRARPWWKPLPGRGMPVINRDWRTHTSWGQHMTRDQIDDELDACSEEMINVVCGSYQLTVVDPEPESAQLWPLLDRWAAHHR